MEKPNSPETTQTHEDHTTSVKIENSCQLEENKDNPSMSTESKVQVFNFFNNKGIIINEEMLPEKDEILVNDNIFRENFLEIVRYAFENSSKIKFVMLYAEYLKDNHIRKVLHYILEDVNKFFTLRMKNKSFFYICKSHKYLDKLLNFNPSFVLDFLSSYEISNYKFKTEEKKVIKYETPSNKIKVPIIKRIENLIINTDSAEFTIPKINLPDRLKLFKLKFSIYIYDKTIKQFTLHKVIEDYHVKIQNLQQGTLIIMRIAITFDSAQGQMSQNFYFFTKSIEEKNLFVIGDNSNHTFSFNEFNESIKNNSILTTPLKINYPNISNFSYFRNFSYITMNSGDVLCNTWTIKEQISSDCLGNETNFFYEKLERPYKLISNVPIKKVVCGRDSMSALTYDGKLYITGSNLFGQLGLNCTYETLINELKQVKFNLEGGHSNPFVLDVAAGEVHYIALVKTQRLNLFKWGFKQGNEPQPYEYESNLITKKNGAKIMRIGNSNVPSLLRFEYVNSITKIYARHHITIIQCLEKINIDSQIYYKRSVYSYGQVNTLQLGIPQITEYCDDYLSVPMKVTHLCHYDVIDFAVGKNNTLFLVNKSLIESISELNTTGEVYGCGLNKNFELGTSEKEISQPVKIIENNQIKTISCGNNFSLLADVKNNLYLLTSKLEKLQYEDFNLINTENVYLNTWFKDKEFDILSIIAEDKKVAFLVNKIN